MNLVVVVNILCLVGLNFNESIEFVFYVKVLIGLDLLN